MKSQDLKGKDLKTPKKSKSDQGRGGNRVYLNEIPLIGGGLVRRIADFDSKEHLKASMVKCD